MIKLYISTFGNAPVDYTRYVESQSLKINDQINVPTLADFTLYNADNLFQVPVRGAYVQVYSTQYDFYPFTGFITKNPQLQLQGLVNRPSPQPRMYRYTVSCTSDEYLLNNKATPFLPVFVNQTKAEILGTIAEVLAPGFLDVTSFAMSGDIVPYFQYDPSQSWSALAKQFADDSRYRYKVVNKKFYFLPYSETKFPITYDSTGKPGTFAPYQFTVNVLDNPLINDVIVMGAPEAGAYASAIFVGDGFSSDFLLHDEVFRGETQLLLQEDWTGGDFNTQLWTVADPGANFNLFQGALNVVGGTGLGQSYILGNNGVELGGQLYLQHGQFVFTDQSEGILGGVYTDVALQQSDCFCGFLVSPSGASGTNIQPLLFGQPVGPVIGTNPIHQYVLITMVTGNQQFRYNRAYRTQAGVQYGGDLIDSPGTITWAIYDIDPYSASIPDPWTYIPQNELPILTTILVTHTESVSAMPGLGLYAPVNSVDLNFSANTLMIAQPPQATLYTYSSPASAGGFSGKTQQAMGFGLLPTLVKQVAALVQGQQKSTSQLSFYNDTIPPAQEPIELRYRVSQQAISRVVDDVSVVQQASIVGDDGHRGTIQQKLSPLPRSSEECDAAAQAFIEDAELAIYTGSYNCSYLFTNYLGASGYPVAGCDLPVVDPDRGINQNFLVQKVTSSYVELQKEIVNHFVEFGQDTYLTKTLNQFVGFPNTLRPVDTALPPLPQSLVNLAASGSFLPDLDNISVLGISCSGINLDFGAVPASGVEVRSSDLGWGTTTVHNLIVLLTTQQASLARSQDVQRFYFRMVNGNMTSRRTSIVQVVAPTPPPQITGYLNMSNYNDPLVVVNVPLNLQDFFGMELREHDSGLLLFHRDYLADSDLTFHLNTAPSGFTVLRNPVLDLYAYNLLGCYSDPTIVTTAGVLGLSGGPLTPPVIVNIQMDTTSSNLTWDVLFPDGVQPSSLYYDVQIDSTGTASFQNLSVSAVHLQANHIYLSPDIVGTVFDAKIRGVDEAGAGDWALFHWPGSLFIIVPGASGGNQCLMNVTNLAASAECYDPCPAAGASPYLKLTFSWDNPPYSGFGGVTIYAKGYLGQPVWRRIWTKGKFENYFTDLLHATSETIDLAFVSFDANGNENAIPYSPQILSLDLKCACALSVTEVQDDAGQYWQDSVSYDLA